MQSQEGGIVPEEYRTEYVVDRVNTFGRAFLGLSVECARCHDHKYDPVTQKEFYRLFSFFNNVNETGQIPYSGVPSPTVDRDRRRRPTRSSRRSTRASRELEDEIDPSAPALRRGFARWLATRPRPLARRGGAARPA